MVSIIHAPVISHKKRTLTHRRMLPKEILASEAIAHVPAFKKPAHPLPEKNKPLLEAAMSPPSPAPTATAPSATPEAPAPVAMAPSVAPTAAATPDIKEIVDQARKALMAQFKDEADAAREMARQRGMQEGRIAGAEEARQEFVAELARVRSLGEKLQHSVTTGLRGLEEVAVAIAFEAVCKIIGGEATTPEGILALVRQAAASAGKTERVAVRLHPQDLAALRAVGALNTTQLAGGAVSWLPDQQIELGGCLLETETGILDARLETQFQRLQAALCAVRQTGTRIQVEMGGTSQIQNVIANEG